MDMDTAADVLAGEITAVLTQLPGWLQAIVYAAFGVLAANLLTFWNKTGNKNPLIDAIMRFLNVVALNVGKNKNADDDDEHPGDGDEKAEK